MSDRVLRKRPASAAAPEPPAKKKAEPKPKKGAVEKAVEKVKETVSKATGSANGASTASAAPAVGDTIDIASFGGELENQDGKKVTLQQLLDESKAGVVLFTYPKASTPGCTTQACLFRDGFHTLTSSGLSIYGLSGDSPKANTTFKTKQNLPYDLLCNPSYGLIGAIGMQDKPAKKTKRGVFAIDKSGKVLVAQKGGPQATVDAVRAVVDKTGAGAGTSSATKEEKEAATTAGEVADAAKAAHLDETPKVGTPA